VHDPTPTCSNIGALQGVVQQYAGAVIKRSNIHRKFKLCINIIVSLTVGIRQDPR
jgi:hypothetical protein